MKQHAFASLSLALGFSLFFAGCNGAGFGGNSQKEGKKTADSGKAAETEKDGNEEASSPVSVAGAFLVQSVVRGAGEVQTDDNRFVIGVTAIDDKSKRLAESDMDFSVKVDNATRQVIPGQTNNGPHFYYIVNRAEIPTGESEVVVKRQNGQEIVARKRLRDIVTAGRSFIPSAATLQSIKKYGFDPKGVCFAGGIPRPNYVPTDVPEELVQFFTNFESNYLDKSFDPSADSVNHGCYASLKRWNWGNLITSAIGGGTTMQGFGYDDSTSCLSFFVQDANGNLSIQVTPMAGIEDRNKAKQIVKNNLCPN